MSENYLFVFDMDGTLVDSQANIVRVMDDTFRLAGLPEPDAVKVRQTIGLSLAQAMSYLLPDETEHIHTELAVLYQKTYRQQLTSEHHQKEKLFDGVHDILQQLEKLGHLCAIATGKSRRGVKRVFEEHGLGSYFHSVQTADDHPSKPHPSMVHKALQETGVDADRCVVIGDTTYDMIMAREAGVLAVGVPWGYHAPDELSKVGVHSILSEWSDLHMLFNELK